MEKIMAFCAACQKDTEHSVVDGSTEFTLICSGPRQHTVEEISADIPVAIFEAEMAEDYAAKKGLSAPDRPCLRSIKFDKSAGAASELLAIHKAHNQKVV